MSTDQMHRPAEYQPAPSSPLPLAGWALIIGSIIYTVYVMAPPRFMDSRWEFDVMGMLANNSLLPLLGIALVLHGREPVIGLQKLVAFRVLLTACFILVVLSLMMIPLAASDQQRLTFAARGEMAGLQAAQSDRDQKIEKMIDRASTVQDLAAMGAMLNLAPTPDERRTLHLDDDFDALKKWTRNHVEAGLADQRNQAVEQYQRRLTGLEKDLVRIIAVNLLTAGCYFVLGFKNLGLFRAHGLNTAYRG